MKRWIVKGIIITVVFWGAIIYVCNWCQADENDLLKEREMLQTRLVQYEQTIVNVRTRIVEINGILKYIDKLEQETKKAEVKDDTRNIPQDKPDSE